MLNGRSVFGNVGDDEMNQALAKTGSTHRVEPYAGNPVHINPQGEKFVKDAGGGGMKGMLGGIMGGGGGGGGGGGFANAGGKPYQSPPVGETQAQMIERQFALRNAAEAQRKEQLFSLVGKVFGF